MRTKKEILANHKAEEKVLVTKAEIFEVDGSREIPEFDMEMVEDNRGWYKKLTLKASTHEDSQWYSDVKGTERIILEDFDLDTVITLPKTKVREEQKIELSFCDLCDIITAFMAWNKLYEKKRGRTMYTPEKMRIVEQAIKLNKKGKKK